MNYNKPIFESRAKDKYYSAERNVQILISLLKSNGIKKVIVSPGATNVTFVGSLQYDTFFELYSCMDERSAAYMALGMAEESHEPVVINCTGATSSREYMPALTAAYYHKLPILVVTSSQPSSRVGQLVAQVTDRATPPVDTVNYSFEMDLVRSGEDEWDRIIKCNEAISRLSINGGGPVHINLITTYNKNYSVKKISGVNAIKRYDSGSALPDMPKGRIGIYIGSHKYFSKRETQIIDEFCASYDAVVFCDHTSNYYGAYRVQAELGLAQRMMKSVASGLDLLIHIGGITGDYTAQFLKPKIVWRVSEDGVIRDQFHKLRCLFYMPEKQFFKHYFLENRNKNCFRNAILKENEFLYNLIPELPFGNIWIAQHTAHKIPAGSCIHFGILNTLRSWNFFNLTEGVESMSNVGGFGIDGILSSLIGASLTNSDRMYYCVLGDLSFFYDMNTLASGLVGNNVRLLIINNGLGAEFRLYSHHANAFGEAANPYMAAAGHNGYKSKTLVRNYANNLGFEYITASTKDEYMQKVDYFCKIEKTEKPIIFEVFTNQSDESEALDIITHIGKNTKTLIMNMIKSSLQLVLGEEKMNLLKKALVR